MPDVQTNRIGHIIDNMFLMFVGLRLAEIITWSWWWVTAPLWGTLLLAFLYAFAKSYREQTRREICGPASGSSGIWSRHSAAVTI